MIFQKDFCFRYYGTTSDREIIKHLAPSLWMGQNMNNPNSKFVSFLFWRRDGECFWHSDNSPLDLQIITTLEVQKILRNEGYNFER